MRRADENFMTMVSTTLGLLDANNTKWNAKPPIAAIVTDITNAAAAISGARQGAGAAVSKGTTMDKDVAEANSIDLVVKLAGFAMAYARKTGSNELREQMKAVKRSRLERVSDDALPDVLGDVHTRLVALGTPAVSYGVTTARLTALYTAIETYRNLMDAPRTVIVTRKGINSTVPAQLKHIREELADLDLLMEDFADSDPAFLTDYKNARIIIDRGGGHDTTPKPPGA